MTWAAAGWPRTTLDAFCVELLDKVDLRTRLHGEAIRVARHARSVGIEVFIVSASPAAVVEQAARVVGIDPVNVIAARETRDAADVVATSVDRPIPYGDGKVTRLRERIGAGRVLYAAFGDNAFDVPLLREARVPVAIRPKARLIARVAEVPGLSVLEQHEAP
jgi:phosphoserine phosphatase